VIRRRREPRGSHVVLHRCESGPEAVVWADAYRSVLKSLGIAVWWKVRVDPADGGALLIGVDYEPSAPPAGVDHIK
jgi:hypothetical protein